jgi:hypothetical protein
VQASCAGVQHVLDAEAAGRGPVALYRHGRCPLAGPPR